MASLIKNLAEVYNTSKSYTTGDVVTYNDKLYSCIANTTGNFNSSDWEEKYLTDLVKGTVNSNLFNDNRPILVQKKYNDSNPTYTYTAEKKVRVLVDVSVSSSGTINELRFSTTGTIIYQSGFPLYDGGAYQKRWVKMIDLMTGDTVSVISNNAFDNILLLEL